MLKTLGSISSLLLAVGMLLFGHGLQSALVPLRSELEGFGTIAIGAGISGYFAGFVVGCIIGPYLIYRAGHIRAYAAMVSLASAVALMHPLLINEWAWIALRFATGFCVACFYIVIESWLNERATNEVRGFIMSSYVIIALSGIMVGQFAVAFGSIEGYTLFILASIVVSFAVIPVALTNSAQPAPITLFRFRPAKLYATSPTAFVASFLIGISAGSTWMLAPVFATAKGFDTTIAASFSATMIAGGAVSQWPIGRLSDKFDRRLVLAALALGSAIACFASGLLTGSDLWGFMALVFLVGIFTHTTYAIAVAHAFDLTEPDSYVETSSGLLLFYGIGSTIGPLIISIIMESTGASSLFLSVGVVQIGMLFYLLWRIRARAAVAEPDREDFDLASTAPVVAMGNEEAADLTTAVLTPEEGVDAIELEETHAAVQLSDIGYLYEGDVEPDPTVEFLPEPEKDDTPESQEAKTGS